MSELRKTIRNKNIFTKNLQADYVYYVVKVVFYHKRKVFEHGVPWKILEYIKVFHSRRPLQLS
jgi:hypothetical protein